MNETVGYNSTAKPYYDSDGWRIKTFTKESFYIALGLQWLNTVLILTLNTAVIITIVRYKKKSRLYFLLMNMAIADLVTGVVDALVNSMERTLGIEYLNYYWFGDDITCRLQRTISSISLCASNFILAATSFDRAMVVAKPMVSFKRGYTLQKILIAACWVLGAVASSPMFTLHSIVVFDPHYKEGIQQVPQCELNLNLQGWKILFYVLLVCYALIPLGIILISYTILIYAIYRRARTPPNSVRGKDNLRLSLVFNRGLPSTKIRSIKLTFGIVLSFVGAWTPFFVMLYLNIFRNYSEPTVMIFVTTYYWNCSVNPIIFFVFHRRRGSRSQSSLYSSDTRSFKLTTSGSSKRNPPAMTIANAKSIPLTVRKSNP